MIESTSDFGGQAVIVHHLGPVKQEVVVIEDMLPTFRFRVTAKELAQFSSPSRIRWEALRQRIL
jgi:hypothetical protein